jgi:hypothetical protein
MFADLCGLSWRGQPLALTPGEVIVRTHGRIKWASRADIYRLEGRNHAAEFRNRNGELVLTMWPSWTMESYEWLASQLSAKIRDERYQPGSWGTPG